MNDAESAPEDVYDPPPHAGKRGRLAGCLLRAGIAVVVAIAIVVAIGTIFDQGPPERQSTGFSAGPADEYARADVNHFQPQHVLLVRYADGSFRAFYDKSSRRQEIGGPCRVSYDEQASLGSGQQLEGMRGAFVEECEGVRAVWRLDGQLVAGNAYGPLDEFQTHIADDGVLIIETGERSCLRSSGTGVPPYRKETCRGAP